MVGVAGFEPATPLVPNGVVVLRSLLALLLANYSVRGRMRLYGATNSCPKVLDFPHYKLRSRTRTNGAIRSFVSEDFCVCRALRQKSDRLSCRISSMVFPLCR